MDVTGGRILVVDDDESLRQTLTRVLEYEGYFVEHACDGEDALARINANQPDLILLDVLMPKMNGRQLLEKLRRDGGTARIPILVMTAINGIEANRTMALDAIDIVEKPFDLDELLNKIALALYRSQESGIHSVQAMEAMLFEAGKKKQETPTE
jgi:two-component system response regulator MprA